MSKTIRTYLHSKMVNGIRKGVNLVTWSQRRCEKCKRFLSKHQQKYCSTCQPKIRKEQMRVIDSKRVRIR